MNTKRTATMLLVAGAAALAGCQGMGGQFARKDLRIPKERSPEEYAAGQLSLGREALGLREWGLAITSFRLVRHMPEHAAEASNGMAIAYANIGRPDLAERLFQQAAALAPGDRRFQANLTRFYETTPAFAVKTDRGAQLAAAPAAAAAPAVRTLAVGQNGATIRIRTTQLVVAIRSWNTLPVESRRSSSTSLGTTRAPESARRSRPTPRCSAASW